MKKGFNILLILCAALVAISCSKTKSYTDMLKDEKKAIERFIDDKGLEILDDFPADSVFKENQFVLLDNGVYLNIIDKGSDQRAVQYKTKMLYRCKMLLLSLLRTMARIVMELLLSLLHMGIIRRIHLMIPLIIM